MTTISPFRIKISEEQLADLRVRLQQSKLPRVLARDTWEWGADPSFMERVLDYWTRDYEWRSVQARLNRLSQFTTEVDGLRLHFIHERASEDYAIPLVLTHGWPSTFVEFEHVIQPLVHPELHGGSAADAFHVVIPSMPGYGWSSAPAGLIDTRRIAAMWRELMVSRLGYPQFAAHGGDWGSQVASWLGVDHSDVVIGIHISMMGLRPYLGPGSMPLDDAEQAWLDNARAQLRRETAYQAIQGTKPSTLAYALTDSPLGLAAWIIEKFHGWTNAELREPPFQLDDLLTNVMIYWLTGGIGSSLWLYAAARRNIAMEVARDERVTPPVGFLDTPHDLFPPPPDRWVNRVYNLTRRSYIGDVGHFVALQSPEKFVDDVRSFFRPFRKER